MDRPTKKRPFPTALRSIIRCTLGAMLMLSLASCGSSGGSAAKSLADSALHNLISGNLPAVEQLYAPDNQPDWSNGWADLNGNYSATGCQGVSYHSSVTPGQMDMESLDATVVVYTFAQPCVKQWIDDPSVPTDYYGAIQVDVTNDPGHWVVTEIDLQDEQGAQ